MAATAKAFAARDSAPSAINIMVENEDGDQLAIMKINNQYRTINVLTIK